MPGIGKLKKLLVKLGKHKIARSCLYIKKPDDVDKAVLSELITAYVKEMRRKYKSS